MVSIIVPVYKSENYIRQCIESIISQTENNIELILILDGEKGSSANICYEFEKKDYRIRVIYQDSQGVSVARNRGIKESKGEWLVFVDSDDWLEPNFVEYMLSQTSKHSSDIYICDYIVDTQKESINDSFFTIGSEKEFNGKDISTLTKNCLVFTDFGNPCAVANAGVPWAKMYRASYLKKENIAFYPGLKRMQDAIFNLNAFYHANTIFYISVPLYHYRKSEMSATTGYKSDFFDTACLFIERVEYFIKANSLEQEYNDILMDKAVILFLEIIKLQIIPKESRLNSIQQCRALNEVRKQYPFDVAINRSKGKYLNHKQKLALALTRNNWSFLVLILTKLNLWFNSRHYYTNH